MAGLLSPHQERGEEVDWLEVNYLMGIAYPQKDISHNASQLSHVSPVLDGLLLLQPSQSGRVGQVSISGVMGPTGSSQEYSAIS